MKNALLHFVTDLLEEINKSASSLDEDQLVEQGTVGGKMVQDMEMAAKSKRLKEYYARHGRIFIVIDATREDVTVPDHLAGDPALKLVLSVRMPQPIYFHSHYIESEFSFSGQSTLCHIPISAIWAAYLPDRDVDCGILWENDMPEQIQAAFTTIQDGSEGEDQPDQPVLPAEQVESDHSNVSLQRQGRLHLRVVK